GMTQEHGVRPAYDLNEFRSELAERTSWATPRTRVWIGALLTLTGVFVATLWFVVSRIDSAPPQLPEVKSPTPVKVEEPNDKWVPRPLFTLVLQNPKKPRRVGAPIVAGAKTLGGSRKGPVVPAAPVPLAAPAANVSPVALATGATQAAVGASAPSV